LVELKIDDVFSAKCTVTLYLISLDVNIFDQVILHVKIYKRPNTTNNNDNTSPKCRIFDKFKNHINSPCSMYIEVVCSVLESGLQIHVH